MDTVKRDLLAKPFQSGVRAAVPLAIPAVPIGVLLGVAVRDSSVVGNWAGWSSSWLMLAGAAQFAAMDLLDQGAGLWAVVAAIFMINARHLMYSAAMSGRFRSAPMWFKLVGSYLLLDQVFAMNGDHAPGHLAQRDPSYQRHYYVGTAVPMLVVWVIGVATGIVLGDVIPVEWEIEFAIPLMFLGLMVMSISNLPGILAAVIGGAIAIVGQGWPSGSGLLTGAIAGVAIAGLVDWYLGNRDSKSSRLKSSA